MSRILVLRLYDKSWDKTKPEVEIGQGVQGRRLGVYLVKNDGTVYIDLIICGTTQNNSKIITKLINNIVSFPPKDSLHYDEISIPSIRE